MILFFKIIFREFFHLFKSARSRAFLWLVFRVGGKPRYQTCSVSFLKYKIQIPDALSFIWQVKEIFVDEGYQFNATSSNPLIYVCGANIGIDCLYFKEKYPQARIKAFEADPKIADILTSNLKNNQIHDVEIIPKAVWTNNDGIEIAIEGADGASIYGEGQKIKTDSLKLKELIEKEQHIDMLKMDIEGAEVEVILDCAETLSKIQNIFIEYHAYVGQPQQLDKILHILSQQGFRYHIQEVLHRKSPLVNHFYRNNTIMDLQLNIFAYKS